MTAEDILNINPALPTAAETPIVSPTTPLAQLLQLWLDSPSSRVEVAGRAQPIEARRLLAACSLLMPHRPESSMITLIVAPGEYSAAKIARAVEDADAHLLDLYTMPAPLDNLQVVLRISRVDPSSTIHSLERYGFTVSSSESSTSSDRELARERIDALRHYLEL